MPETPLYFPISIDVREEILNYTRITQQELNNLAFHDDRFNLNKEIVKKEKLVHIKIKKNNVHYIFHTAFCGSTFLSRLLGNTDGYHSIREPNVFMELANFKRVNERFKKDPQLLNSWINKTVNSFQKTVNKTLLFKPTNATNNIIEELFNTSDGNKAIFMYLDLEDFLISILKKGEAGRSFIRNLYNIFSLDSSPYAITNFRQINGLTDMQVACLVWSMQMHEYSRYYQSQENIKFVNAEEFLKNPQNGLLKISSFFSMPMCDQDIKNLTEKGLFNNHAKHKGVEYTAMVRKKEKATIQEKYTDEILATKNWLKTAIQTPKLPPLEKHIKFQR